MSWVTPDRVSVLQVLGQWHIMVYDYKCGKDVKSKTELDPYGKLQILLLALAGAVQAHRFLLPAHRHLTPYETVPTFHIDFEDIRFLLHNVHVIYQKPLELENNSFKQLTMTLTQQEIDEAVELLKTVTIKLNDKFYKAQFNKYLKHRKTFNQDLNPKQMLKTGVSFQRVLF